MRRADVISKAVGNYDACLYAQEMPDGRIDIYRKNRENVSPPHFIFSLTDTWHPSGRKVDWGVEPVLHRIRAHDLWRDDNFVKETVAELEKQPEKDLKEFRNNTESFLYDFRKQFSRTFNDVNTASMDKKLIKEN